MMDRGPIVQTADAIATILPTSLSNLVGWYRADGITGKSDGETIAQWDDESGNANHLTAVGSPTYETAEQNTLPVVRLDGLSQYLTRATFGGTAGTIIMAFRCGTRTAVDAVAMFSDTDGVTDYLSIEWSAANQLTMDQVTGTPETTGTATVAGFADGTTALLVWSSSGTAWTFRVNGVAFDFSYSVGSNDGEWSDDVVGGDSITFFAFLRTSASNIMGADAFEILVYSDQKTGADLAALELYLNEKWAIY